MRIQKKPTRADKAYQAIKDEIRHNRMPPGLQVPEPELSQSLDVSRPTLREALVRLEAEGLVELIPRKGMRVLPLRAQDMQEIYELLTIIEPEIAARVAGLSPSEEQLAPLEAATHDMKEALKAGDLEAWAEADDRFHLAILDLHGNGRLRDVVTGLADQVHRARMITLRLRELPLQSNDEHEEILQTLRDANPGEARKKFNLHRERAARELVGILEKSGIGQL